MSRLFAHPVHPMLVSFPLGLLPLVPLWDFLSWSQLFEDAAVIARWTELAGLVGGVLAALTGARDLLGVARDPERLTTGLRHAFAAASALSLFVVAFVLRRANAPVGLGILVLDALGAAALVAAGWFGGHLVFHHGVGVEPGAHARDAEQR